MACITPTQIKNPAFPARSLDRYIMVPCGRCPKCLARRSSGWAFRLWQETKVCHSAYFITLTYDTKYVPISPLGNLTLDKSDFQKFMKRLRKNQDSDLKIRYYACGEYGGRTRRPHYHAVVFNAEKEAIEKSWKLGHIMIGNVSMNSIAYVCKYIDKGRWKPRNDYDDRIPEFSLMSKGLGASYMTDAIVKYHKADLERNYVTLEGGVKIAMPRYYREKMFDETERKRRANLAMRNAAKAEIKKSEWWKSRNKRGDYDEFSRQQVLSVIQRHAAKIKRERNKI